LELAARNRATLPAETVDGLRDWFTFRDFGHFIEVYVAVTRCLRSVADYELITYEFGAEMARQNVRYAEVTFTPNTHHFILGVPHETYFTGLTRGRRRAQDEFGIEINWVFDTVLNPADPERTRQGADYTTSVAIEGKGDGVVALGLGGLEIGHSFELVAPWF